MCIRDRWSTEHPKNCRAWAFTRSPRLWGYGEGDDNNDCDKKETVIIKKTMYVHDYGFFETRIFMSNKIWMCLVWYKCLFYYKHQVTLNCTVNYYKVN